jgi:Flp pilus assembly protein TadG
MVEMVFLLPLLLLLLFGMLEFGRMYNARITLTHATREGARTLAVERDGDAAVTATRDAAVSLDQSALSVSSPATCETGDPATVTSEYVFTYSIPFYSGNTMTMTSSSVMRCGG